jgi:hypothetical protein
MPTFVKVVYISVVVTAVVIACVYFVWWARSFYMRKMARERPLRAQRISLWRDPGAVERLDFQGGPGGREGAPAPPFQFVCEHDSGSNPCMSVKDANGRTWRVKWGDEVRSETFVTRLVWAVGYHVEHAYFIPAGRIEEIKDLGRARQCVAEDCTFKDARFELDERGVTKLFDEHGWSWDDNPFAGTRELNGLKIMVMLTSNWDNKDVRDVARGSNTAIFRHRLADGTVEARYLIIDWGATMGRWGSALTRAKWDCAGFSAQTPELITGVENGIVSWGYVGQRTDEARDQITVEDVEWLYRYLGRITDEQLRAGLAASGATLEEVECFTKALRQRIETLGRVCGAGELLRPASQTL